MPKVYARTTKITNASGRSDYISDMLRQEHIVLHQSYMEHSWQEYSAFEKANQKSMSVNNEAREIVIALPNELSQDLDKLKSVMDEISISLLGNNRDHEYAVHWNKERTNLHAHLLFSEREKNKTREPKIYKKDIWREHGTNKLAKANSENAFLYARKGEIQKDADGNIKYNEDPFTSKDKKFVEKAFMNDRDIIIQNTVNKHGFEMDRYEKGEVAQKKLYKGSSDDYIRYAKEFNQKAKDYNLTVKQLDQLVNIVEKAEPLAIDIVSSSRQLHKLEAESLIKRAMSASKRNELIEGMSDRKKALKRLLKPTDHLLDKARFSNLLQRVSMLKEYVSMRKAQLDNSFQSIMSINSYSRYISVKEPKKSLIKSLEDNKKKVTDKDKNIKGKSYTRNTR